MSEFVKATYEDLMKANKILIQQRDTAQQQRDTLLAALEMIIALLCHPGSFVTANDIDHAKAAVADAKKT